MCARKHEINISGVIPCPVDMSSSLYGVRSSFVGYQYLVRSWKSLPSGYVIMMLSDPYCHQCGHSMVTAQKGSRARWQRRRVLVLNCNKIISKSVNGHSSTSVSPSPLNLATREIEYGGWHKPSPPSQITRGSIQWSTKQ